MVNDMRRRAFGPPASGVVPPGPYDLVLTLTGPEGQEVQRQTLTIPAHPRTGRDIPVVMHVLAPAQWTAETPNLYMLRVEIVDGKAVQQTRTVAVGFRQITTEGGVFKSTGRP